MIFKSLKTVCWLCITVVTLASTANAQAWNENLRGDYSYAGGPVSIGSNRPVTFQSLSVHTRSEDGRLIGGTNPAPFKTVTTNTDNEWAVESSSDVTIDGIVELDLEVEPGVFLAGQAFDGSTTTNIAFNGKRTLGPISLGTCNCSGFLLAAYPEEGGKILLWGAPQNLPIDGIELVAEPGILTAGDSPAPFQFFIPNDAAPGNVTLSILGTPVTLDGVFELDVFVAPNSTTGSISATWGLLTSFPVTMTPSLEKFVAEGTCIIPPDDLVGDLDDNGTVEFSDFLTLAGNFGFEVDTYGEGDINCNGTVDFEDFIRLGGNFGMSRSAASAPIPEPATANLLLIGLLVTMQFRRRWT